MNNKNLLESKGLIICVIFTGLGFLICNTVFARNEKEEMISVAEIEQLMKRGSVEGILKEEYNSGLIHKVEYDRRKRKTNFDELVYQEHLNPKKRKPVLVFFYDTKNTLSDGDEREAVIIKELSKRYNGKIKFVCIDVAIEPDYTGFKNRGIFGTEVKIEGIKGIPSLAIYSQFDLANVKTIDNSKERIKQIDILRGGPGNNEVFNAWLKFMRDKWIPTNLTSPNNVFVWRFHNSADEKKVIYN